MRKRVQHIKIEKGMLVRGAVVLGCLALAGLLQLVRVRTVEGLTDQMQAQRFAPSGGYAQVSAFFSEQTAVTPTEIRHFRYEIETALTENAVTKESAESDARLFIDCYSAEGIVTLTRAGKTVTANAVGVGGDFFSFHPVRLLTGSYLSGEDLMTDKIVIDEETAWQLFGSADVCGQTIEVGGMPHLVQGVVRRETGRLEEAAGLGSSVVYLAYGSLSEYGTITGAGFVRQGENAESGQGSGGGNLGGGAARRGAGPGSAGAESAGPGSEGGSTGTGAGAGASESGGINCYEVVMPDPVAGFAAGIARVKLGFDAGQMQVVDNTARFDNPALVKILLAYGTRSMLQIPVHYPYWENVARGTEDILAPVALLQALCLLLPVLLVAAWVVQMYRHKQWTAAGVYEAVKNRIYDAQARMKSEKEKWRHF